MRRLTVAVVMLSSLALTGCGGQREMTQDEVTIYVHDRSLLPRGGDDAEVSGALALRDGCVVLQVDEADDGYPVVWPAGTTIVSSEPLVVGLPSGDELALGDRVAGGGGYYDPDGSDRIDVSIPNDCFQGQYREVAVFNPGQDLTIG